MTSHISPAKLPGFLKLIVALLVTLTLAGLPFASNADDATSAPASGAASAPAEAPAAPEPIDPNAVVATVGGETITEADLGFEANKLGQQALSQISPDQLRAVLLTQLISAKLMANQAKAEGLDQSDEFKLYQQFLTEDALYEAFIRHNVVEAVTDDQVKAAYDKQIAAMPQQDEVHARHILLNSEDDAKAIKAQLDAGADFTKLAKEKSIEPGAKQSGGDLGYFTQDKMVKSFADAAFKLKVGQISDPVQTQFGWHIIEVLDRRPAAKPTLAQLSEQIKQQLYAEKFRDLLTQLRGAAEVDIPDAGLKSQVEQQFMPQQQPQ